MDSSPRDSAMAGPNCHFHIPIAVLTKYSHLFFNAMGSSNCFILSSFILNVSFSSSCSLSCRCRLLASSTSSSSVSFFGYRVSTITGFTSWSVLADGWFLSSRISLFILVIFSSNDKMFNPSWQIPGAVSSLQKRWNEVMYPEISTSFSSSCPISTQIFLKFHPSKNPAACDNQGLSHGLL